MTTRINGLGILGFAFGIGMTAYAVYQDSKRNKLEQDVRDKLNMSMNSVASKATIDIDEQIIGSTVERIVKNKVNSAATEAVNSIKADMYNDINKRVKREVEAQYNTLTEDVSEKIADQVASISEDALSNKVLPRVEEKLMRKGEGILQKVKDESVRELGKSIELVNSVKKTLDVINGNTNQSNGTNRTISFNV